MQVTVRKIANGYVVVLPPTHGNSPGHLPGSLGGANEHFCADLDVVMSKLADHFEPLTNNPQE